MDASSMPRQDRVRAGRERSERGGSNAPEQQQQQQQQQQAQQAPVKLDSNNQNIMFNQSKDEPFSLTQGYKKFQRELKNWKIATNRDEITLERLVQCRVFVCVAPQRKFQSSEIEALKKYLQVYNGSLLLLFSEGGEVKLNTNLNVLLDEFGINVNNDSIIRTSYFKYFNPKEALVPDGVLNRSIAETAGKQIEVGVSANDKNELAARSLTYVYPFGATLNVTKPSIPVLSSGSVCFPLKRPLCALYGCSTVNNSQMAAFKKTTAGKICVLGSAHIFHDTYIDKEENRRLLDSLVKYLTDDTVTLNQIDSEDPDINELNYIQNIN